MVSQVVWRTWGNYSPWLSEVKGIPKRISYGAQKADCSYNRLGLPRGHFKILYDPLLGPSTGSGRTVKTRPSVRVEPFGGVYPEPNRRAPDRLVEPHFEIGSRWSVALWTEWGLPMTGMSPGVRNGP